MACDNDWPPVSVTEVDDIGWTAWCDLCNQIIGPPLIAAREVAQAHADGHVTIHERRVDRWALAQGERKRVPVPDQEADQ